MLLAGIVFNNSILLIDFIESTRRRGDDLSYAVESAIRLRTRSILMTALSTIALELAVGRERLSPLAVVAISGFLISTQF